jgi:predicted metal-dependent phosphoesterase TrpH
VTDNVVLRADLHLHTTASDGRLSPPELVALAAKKRLNVIAVTDHDTISGIEAALNSVADYKGMRLVPGVEINTDVPGAEVHMLGYFIDFQSNNLISILDELRSSRVTRAAGMLEKLDKLGMHIEWDKLKELSRDSVIGRPHIAQAMVEEGYVKSTIEAFDNYIGRNGPAYVEHKKMTPEEVVKLIREVNGIPVLAHPDNIPGLEAMLADLKDTGLTGIEVYYGTYTNDVIRRLLNLAKRFDLIVTGGSDYHAFNNERETMIGAINIPQAVIRQLYTIGNAENPNLCNKYSLFLD